MTKLVRKVARQDALRELREDMLYKAGMAMVYSEGFITREKRVRKCRNTFGKGAYSDKETDQNGKDVIEKINKFIEARKLYETILLSSDEFVFLGD